MYSAFSLNVATDLLCYVACERMCAAVQCRPLGLLDGNLVFVSIQEKVLKGI